ncbi:MAG: hypothetical protein AAFQ78_00925, partial [Bacteroidota bacterium]
LQRLLAKDPTSKPRIQLMRTGPGLRKKVAYLGVPGLQGGPNVEFRDTSDSEDNDRFVDGRTTNGYAMRFEPFYGTWKASCTNSGWVIDEWIPVVSSDSTLYLSAEDLGQCRWYFHYGVWKRWTNQKRVELTSWPDGIYRMQQQRQARKRERRERRREAARRREEARRRAEEERRRRAEEERRRRAEEERKRKEAQARQELSTKAAAAVSDQVAAGEGFEAFWKASEHANRTAQQVDEFLKDFDLHQEEKTTHRVLETVADPSEALPWQADQKRQSDEKEAKRGYHALVPGILHAISGQKDILQRMLQGFVNVPGSSAGDKLLKALRARVAQLQKSYGPIDTLEVLMELRRKQDRWQLAPHEIYNILAFFLPISKSEALDSLNQEDWLPALRAHWIKHRLQSLADQGDGALCKVLDPLRQDLAQLPWSPPLFECLFERLRATEDFRDLRAFVQFAGQYPASEDIIVLALQQSFSPSSSAAQRWRRALAQSLLRAQLQKHYPQQAQALCKKFDVLLHKSSHYQYIDPILSFLATQAVDHRALQASYLFELLDILYPHSNDEKLCAQVFKRLLNVVPGEWVSRAQAHIQEAFLYQKVKKAAEKFLKATQDQPQADHEQLTGYTTLSQKARRSVDILLKALDGSKEHSFGDSRQEAAVRQAYEDLRALTKPFTSFIDAYYKFLEAAKKAAECIQRAREATNDSETKGLQQACREAHQAYQTFLTITQGLPASVGTAVPVMCTDAVDSVQKCIAAAQKACPQESSGERSILVQQLNECLQKAPNMYTWMRRQAPCANLLDVSELVCDTLQSYDSSLDEAGEVYKQYTQREAQAMRTAAMQKAYAEVLYKEKVKKARKYVFSNKKHIEDIIEGCKKVIELYQHLSTSAEQALIPYLRTAEKACKISKSTVALFSNAGEDYLKEVTLKKYDQHGETLQKSIKALQEELKEFQKAPESQPFQDELKKYVNVVEEVSDNIELLEYCRRIKSFKSLRSTRRLFDDTPPDPDPDQALKLVTEAYQRDRSLADAWAGEVAPWLRTQPQKAQSTLVATLKTVSTGIEIATEELLGETGSVSFPNDLKAALPSLFRKEKNDEDSVSVSWNNHNLDRSLALCMSI